MKIEANRYGCLIYRKVNKIILEVQARESRLELDGAEKMLFHHFCFLSL